MQTVALHPTFSVEHSLSGLQLRVHELEETVAHVQRVRGLLKDRLGATRGTEREKVEELLHMNSDRLTRLQAELARAEEDVDRYLTTGVAT